MAERFIQAEPWNGNVIHAVSASAPRSSGVLLLTRALCGIRGRDAWGFGGMRPIGRHGYAASPEDYLDFTAESARPTKVGWDGRTINVTCPKCLAKIKRAALAAANVSEIPTGSDGER